jgi:hypothetical protein
MKKEDFNLINSFVDQSNGTKYNIFEYESELLYLSFIVNMTTKMIVEYSYRNSDGEGNEIEDLPLRNVATLIKNLEF